MIRAPGWGRPAQRIVAGIVDHARIFPIMLQRLRSATGSWVAKAILGFLVLSFLGWGIANYNFSTLSNDTVAEVGATKISYPEFRDAYDLFLQDQGLTAVGSDVARQLGLAQTVLDNLTRRALYQAESSALGLTASDVMVRREIEGRPIFQDLNARFDRTRLNFFLHENGLSEKAFVESVRKDLGRRQLIDALTAGDAAPTALVDRLFDYFGERRSVEFLSFSTDSVPIPAVKDGTALKAFYDERKEDFRRPELRSLTYVLINPEAIAETIDISDEAIEAAFKARRGEFGQPELRTISQILFPSEAEAVAAAEALSDVSVEDMPAKAEGLGLEVIELGEFTKEAVPNARLADAAFALEGPGVTGAFEGAFGWSVAIVTAVEPGVEPALADVRDQLAGDLALDQAYDLVSERGEKLQNGYGGGLTLEEAATRVGLTTRTVVAVDSTGRGPDGAALKDLPAGPTFLRTAFELDTGEVSFLKTTESNAMFMVRVDGITPAVIPKFETVRDDVMTAWRKDARIDAAETRAETLATRLSEGGDLALLAQMMTGETGTIDSLARTGQGPEGVRLPAELARALFKDEPGHADYAVDGDRVIVARVTGVVPAADASDKAFRNKLADAVAGGMAQDLIEQMGATLRQRHDIATYPDVYQQVYRRS